ncbi:hypothetical protein H7992_07125 [Sporosarcina sp. resist]|uniref:hypothetical protein n=1 Tax=Sporosarcina sp. resist TaxID=2762563 RepID=UPI00164CF020|nr:hypothetical protein [Sporosarcina sp. resist]QNK89429.1 hypothetical protein H7992_07125 [Sporosarcina sp. resist]
MENVKNYRVKTGSVKAMRTFIGQPIHEIRDYMLGCENIALGLGDLREGFNVSIEGTGGARDLTPGDYIVMSEDRHAFFMSPVEFEKKYEEQVDSTELYYVVTKYGFPVKDGEMMLKDERIRPILLASFFEQNKFSPAVTVNQSFNVKDEADIGRIVSGITEQMHVDILKIATKVY